MHGCLAGVIYWNYKCVPDLIFTTNKKNGSQQTKSPKNGGNKITFKKTSSLYAITIPWYIW